MWDPDLHLFPGNNWPVQVGRALEESDAMVVLLTPNCGRVFEVIDAECVACGGIVPY